jgi:hypothetical protein
MIVGIEGIGPRADTEDDRAGIGGTTLQYLLPRAGKSGKRLVFVPDLSRSVIAVDGDVRDDLIVSEGRRRFLFAIALATAGGKKDQTSVHIHCALNNRSRRKEPIRRIVHARGFCAEFPFQEGELGSCTEIGGGGKADAEQVRALARQTGDEQFSIAELAIDIDDSVRVGVFVPAFPDEARPIPHRQFLICTHFSILQKTESIMALCHVHKMNPNSVHSLSSFDFLFAKT